MSNKQGLPTTEHAAFLEQITVLAATNIGLQQSGSYLSSLTKE
jgi:hypothetical protein